MPASSDASSPPSAHASGGTASLVAAPDGLPATLQALPPAAARLCLEVERELTAHGDMTGALSLHGAHCVVAFSGGADSTALLLILHYLRHRLGIDISALHVDHGLRDDSPLEAVHAAAFCERLGIHCTTHRVAVSELAATWRTGTEEAGRRARYGLLTEALPLFERDWICTGHHLDDLAEDVLLRLVRGCGWPALGGMEQVHERRRILRPLLATSKEKLVDFLTLLRVRWTEDPSNASGVYRRNRIRQGVMPLLLAENPGFLDQVRSLWTLARIDADFWRERIPVPTETTTLAGAAERGSPSGSPRPEDIPVADTGNADSVDTVPADGRSALPVEAASPRPARPGAHPPDSGVSAPPASSDVASPGAVCRVRAETQPRTGSTPPPTTTEGRPPAQDDASLPSHVGGHIHPASCRGTVEEVPCQQKPLLSGPQAAQRRSRTWGDVEDEGTHVTGRRLKRLHKAERLRLYKAMLENMGEGQPRVDTLLALDTAWLARRGGAKFAFAGRKVARLQRGGVTFYRD